jgi:hypothetical protein
MDHGLAWRKDGKVFSFGTRRKPLDGQGDQFGEVRAVWKPDRALTRIGDGKGGLSLLAPGGQFVLGEFGQI